MLHGWSAATEALAKRDECVVQAFMLVRLGRTLQLWVRCIELNSMTQ